MLPPEFRLPFYISYASITLQLSRMLQISFPLCQLFTQNIISLFVLTFMLLPFQSLPQVLNFDIAECLSMKLKKKKNMLLWFPRKSRDCFLYLQCLHTEGPTGIQTFSNPRLQTCPVDSLRVCNYCSLLGPHQEKLSW